MNILKNRVAAVATGALLIAGLSATGGAYASSLIGSEGIQNDSVRSIDLKDGYGVGVKDLKPGLLAQVTAPDSDTVYDDSALEAQIAALTNRVEELEAGDPAPVQHATWHGTGASVVDGKLVLNSEDTGDDPETPWNDAATAFAVADEPLNLMHAEGDLVKYTYTVSQGAEPGQGAPRLVVTIGGKRYTTVNETTPDYGTKAGDTYTVSVALVSYLSNTPAAAPTGRITDASFAYDNQQKPGVVTISGLTIGGQAVSFQK